MTLRGRGRPVCIVLYYILFIYYLFFIYLFVVPACPPGGGGGDDHAPRGNHGWEHEGKTTGGGFPLQIRTPPLGIHKGKTAGGGKFLRL